jgi:hypothetical protein
MRRKLTLPASEVVFAALDYCPETGFFTWKRRGDKPNNWNALFAGKQAGVKDGSYIYITLNYQRIGAHRIAILFATGAWPSYFVDHINGNGHDNRVSNIREADHRQNSMNRKVSRSSTTGITGVQQARRGKPWQAKIMVEGKRIWLGSFDTQEEAIAARRHGEEKYFGSYAPIPNRLAEDAARMAAA